MRVSTAVCTLWERKLRTFPKILMSTGSSYTKAPRILTWSPAPVTRGMALCGVVKGGTTPQHHAPAGPAGLGTFCMAQMLHCFGWPLTYDVTPSATHLVPAIRSPPSWECSRCLLTGPAQVSLGMDIEHSGRGQHSSVRSWLLILGCWAAQVFLYLGQVDRSVIAGWSAAMWFTFSGMFLCTVLLSDAADCPLAPGHM